MQKVEVTGAFFYLYHSNCLGPAHIYVHEVWFIADCYQKPQWPQHPSLTTGRTVASWVFYIDF